MSNLDISPAEVPCRPDTLAEPEVIGAREVPLGGIRAMTVRRTLPARGRSFIGPWCFADHYGPDDVQQTGGMDVAPHPHIGLQTVSWLFRGEIDHRDSLGTHELVLPGELNLMTAGRGIAHSEVSTRATTVLHGVQLWAALPQGQRGTGPAFQHYAPGEVRDAGLRLRVFLGSVGGESSPVTTFSPMVGAELLLPAHSTTELPLESDFEHGILVDSGPVTIDGMHAEQRQLVALPPGRRRLRLRASDFRVRLLLIGGTPMESGLVMWWNFVGESHDEIVEARRDWQSEIGAPDPRPSAPGEPESPGRPESPGPAGPTPARFGTVRGYDGPPLPAPRMPGGRLKPRTPGTRPVT